MSTWASRFAKWVGPEDVMGNMGLRARLWRAACDWNWGIMLNTPYRRRMLWVWRRLWDWDRV